jgi:hypothetical protein
VTDPIDEFFGVGLLRSNPHEFNVTLEMTAKEYQQYLDALSKCSRLHDRLAFELVERNRIDLRSLCSFAAISLTLPREFASADRTRISRVVMGQTINWLTAVRLFLDHAETDLKRRFGATSGQVAHFKQLAQESFDRSFPYRFVWKLRNYVQHCGWPLSSMSMSLRPSAPGMAFRDVEFLLDPQALLEAYDAWGPVKKDLRARTAPFPLIEMAEDATEELRKIAHELLVIDVLDAAESVASLEEALVRIGSLPDAYRPCIFHGFSVPDGSSIRISPSEINVALVARLTRVAAGTLEPADLISEPQNPAPPVFDLDPRAVVQRLRAESRGVQLMAAYLGEGSGTRAFADLVNSIVASDGGIQLLVDGLVNVTAVLLFMTAGALGAEPKGLLSGLLQHYRPAEERPHVVAMTSGAASSVEIGDKDAGSQPPSGAGRD